ncbi:hypothetical protein niasHS_000608 [Heterodera schachtii]|uniref:C2H2-type domain-containing protein n=1 Tax=Heterodera schachtii TaxID=97005 RepID=A0ABD2K4X7_HETSC
MIDGSAGSSLQSLRELSSENSEFELVDVVGSRLSVHSKQPSSVVVLRSPTSHSVQTNINNNSAHQNISLKNVKEFRKVHDKEQRQPNPMDVLLENERLRTELAEAKTQLATMSKEIETYRKNLSEREKKQDKEIDKVAEKLQMSDKTQTELRNWKNGTKTSSMYACLGSTLQESNPEKSTDEIGHCLQFDIGTTKPKDRPVPIPLVCESKKAFGVRSASSPPIPKLSPPRNVADAQLLDLLGSVQPMRDANRPAAPPPKKNSWCKMCGQWLCNSYFLRAHIQSQHATQNESDGGNGRKRGGKQQQNGTESEVHFRMIARDNSKHRSMPEGFVVESALPNSVPSQRLIDLNAETRSAPKKLVRPKPIRPVPNGKFQIKWEEEEETEEEEEIEGSEILWSFIGQMEDKVENGKIDSEKKLSGELQKYNESQANWTHKHCTDLSSPIVHYPSSTNSPSISPFIPQFRSLSSAPNRPQQLSSSSSASSDSSLTSSTASSTLNSTNNTTESEEPFHGQSRKGTAQEESRNETHASRLDDSILNRLLHIEPPNGNKQKSLNNTCHTFVTNSRNESPSDFRWIETADGLGENNGRKSCDHNIGKELDKLRDDFHSLQFLHDQNGRQTKDRLETLENRMTELNVKLRKLDIQTETNVGEQKAQMTNLTLKNGRLCEKLGDHQKELKAVQNRIELLEQCHLREFVAGLPPVHEDGSLVLSQFENGNYFAEMKILFQSGSRFCSGFAIKSSAHFRNYPSNLFNQIIEHALTTRQVQKMTRWAVLNFPANEMCPWPQALLYGTDDDNNDNNKYNYRKLIRRREVLSDRVVYSLFNQHSAHKFVVNIYYSSESDLFKQMHCFTIRRHRPSR